jgi:hypothetical protein
VTPLFNPVRCRSLRAQHPRAAIPHHPQATEIVKLNDTANFRSAPAEAAGTVVD